MLTKLAISNYQLLKSINLDLKKVTVLVGQTGSGKSALVRALKGLMTAESGSGIVRYGEKEAKVVIVIDGHTIGWAKGKGKNVYIVDGVRYEKVGLDVPEEAKAILNVAEAGLGAKTRLLNIQSQHDPPFLLTESGSEVGEYLSKLSGLDKLCYIVEQIAIDVRRSKQELEAKFQEVTVLRDREKYLQGVQADAHILAEKTKELQIVKKGIEAVEAQIQMAQEHGNLMNKIMVMEDLLKEIDKTLTQTEAYAKDLRLLEDQKTALDALGRLEGHDIVLKTLLTVMDKVETEATEWMKTVGDWKVKGKAYVEYNLLNQIMSGDRDKLKENIAATTALSVSLQEELMALGKCPCCGKELNEACRSEIVQFVEEKCGLRVV